MKYWDMSKDERKDWRKHDVTRAYLAELEERAEEIAAESVSAVRNGNTTGATWGFGKAEGIQVAQETAVRE